MSNESQLYAVTRNIVRDLDDRASMAKHPTKLEWVWSCCGYHEIKELPTMKSSQGHQYCQGCKTELLGWRRMGFGAIVQYDGKMVTCPRVQSINSESNIN